MLVRLQPWFRAFYTVERQGNKFNPEAGHRGAHCRTIRFLTSTWLGVAYLVIGLFVYFRRGNAPKSLHFLFLCLVSFVLSTSTTPAS